MKEEAYILVVEDSATQARQIEETLKQSGFPVRLAFDGKEALGIIKEKKPLLAIVDILMPVMDGYELCAVIKQDVSLKDVPVVLLTQLSDPKEIIKGMECGADDFIVKPYSEEVLLTRIKAVLSVRLRQEVENREVKILVVEDSPTQAEQMKYMLEGHGFTVFVAFNGKEGLETARTHKPTIVVSDILMPVMDGYELAYEIKHDPELGKTPIILVTSLFERKDIVRRASVVADGYFTKPYDDRYLLSKIETLLAQSKSDDLGGDGDALEVTFEGDNYRIKSSRRQILTFLLSTYENAVEQNRDLIMMQRELQLLNEQLEERIIERTRQLQASEEKYRTLLETSADAMVVVGEDNRVHFANKAAEALFAVSFSELAGRPFDIAVSDGLTCDIERARKDGAKVIAEMRVVATTWGEEKAHLATFRDIGERRRKEAELLKSSKLESLGTLAGGIAHDFNNLLTGIVGNVSIARLLTSPEDRTYKPLYDAEKAALRAKDLTQQLLTFARGGAPVKKVTAITGLIRDTVGFCLRGTNVRCELNVPDDLHALEVDEGQISQVIHNLVINAEQAMLKGGVLTVAAENVTIGQDAQVPLGPGRYVRLTVRDTGIGIPAENLGKIFDPYFTTKEEGSGLGLATVYSIIKNHDGYISLESKVGSGTAFFIYLPATDREAPSEARAAEEKPVSGKGRVLLMDDEEIVRDAASAILTELGYDVAYASNGEEAIRLYSKEKEAGRPFDAVIMDLTIPGGMGGKEAIKKLLEIDPGARAIVSSGYSNDSIMSDFRNYGFSAVIAKPYRVADLSKTVHTVISSSKK